MQQFLVASEQDWPAAWQWLRSIRDLPTTERDSSLRVLALEGDLGAGKTSFAKAILAACGYDGEVTSPTFSLVQQYPCELGTVSHFDLYRLDSVDEVLDLGFEEYLDTSAFCLVEWPEVARELLLPSETCWVRVEHSPEGGRLLLAL